MVSTANSFEGKQKAERLELRTRKIRKDWQRCCMASVVAVVVLAVNTLDCMGDRFRWLCKARRSWDSVGNRPARPTAALERQPDGEMKTPQTNDVDCLHQKKH
jgi:hypothetical protein